MACLDKQRQREAEASKGKAKKGKAKDSNGKAEHRKGQRKEKRMFLDRTMIDANELMRLAWDNPLWSKEDCNILFEMIMILISHEE